MKLIPETEKALVLRADFSDDAAWEAVCEAITEPVGEFQAHVDFLDEREYHGIGANQLVALMPQDSSRRFFFVVDLTTLSQPDHPVLCIDLRYEPGRTFRVIPSEMWSVENNLSLANMDFSEFANAVDSDGVFRGFPTGDVDPDFEYVVVIDDGQGIVRAPIVKDSPWEFNVSHVNMDRLVELGESD